MNSVLKQLVSIFMQGALMLAVVAPGATFAVPNTWNGGGDGTSWSDGGNWSAGVPPAEDDMVIIASGTPLLTGETPKLASFAMTGGTLTFKWDALGGIIYGNTNAPILPGSGGGGHYSSSQTFGGNGGGTIWLEVDQSIALNGTLTANGGQAYYAAGGGSGGGIFLATPAFQGGEHALIRANGSAGYAHDSNVGGAGGGGRIAVAIGLAEGARDSLIAGLSVPGLASYSLDTAFAGALSAAVSPIGPNYQTLGVERAPSDGTCVFITTNITLVIDGDPGQYGDPLPQAYGGTPYLAPGASITNTVVSPADENAGQRWACLGWELTDVSGLSLDSGTGTQAIFTLSATRILTWNWTNEYRLAISSASTEQGSVFLDANGWHANGIVIGNIWATPTDGSQFTEWTGDVPTGHETDNPLTITMDRPRTLVAQFASSTGMTRYWNGTGAWETPANWTPQGMPGPYDHAVVASGEALLSMPRIHENITISNNATLVFSNWTTSLTASNVIVLNHGTITLPSAFEGGQMSNRVWIVCTNLTLASGGIIEVSDKGYRGGPPGSSANGSGPGGGIGGKAVHGSGGGYGGRGAWSYGSLTAQGGLAYATAAEPVAPGSGGGTRSESYAKGGNGGGAICIQASGDVRIDGTVSANGTQGSFHSGGGSGGGIWIACRRFTGDGVICAKGGALQGNGGPGGGGRIALHYTSLIGVPKVRLEAKNGANAVSPWHNDLLRFPRYWLAEPGTLYLSDAELLSEPSPNLFGRIEIPGFSTWSPAALTLGNDVLLQFGSGFKLNIGGAVTITSGGALELLQGSSLDCGGLLTLDGGRLVMKDFTQMTCHEDFVLSNSGKFYAFSAPTNGTTPFGATVDVAGDIQIDPSCWIYPDANITNGAPVRFRAQRVQIASGGGFDADYRGFGGPLGTWRASGYGPGAGVKVSYASGAGYGGRGGDSTYNGWNAVGGTAYGNVNAPILPGSGGGAHGSGRGGHGGGVVWIEASQSMTLNGILSANGLTTTWTASGGGGGRRDIYQHATPDRWYDGASTGRWRRRPCAERRELFRRRWRWWPHRRGLEPDPGKAGASLGWRTRKNRNCRISGHLCRQHVRGGRHNRPQLCRGARTCA